MRKAKGISNLFKSIWNQNSSSVYCAIFDGIFFCVEFCKHEDHRQSFEGMWTTSYCSSPRLRLLFLHTPEVKKITQVTRWTQQQFGNYVSTSLPISIPSKAAQILHELFQYIMCVQCVRRLIVHDIRATNVPQLHNQPTIRRRRNRLHTFQIGTTVHGGRIRWWNVIPAHEISC